MMNTYIKPDNIRQQEEVVYYSLLINSWVQTQMERDKLLVRLSFSGIVLLIVILLFVDKWYFWQIELYCGAFLGFATTIGSIIYILGRNSKHIEEIISKNTSQDPMLKNFDKISLATFIVGTIFFMAVVVSISAYKLQ